MHITFSCPFESDIGVKQGDPLSSTLFGICIDELEEMILNFAEEKNMDGPQLKQWVICILMYADDVVLFAKIWDAKQQLMEELRSFYEKSGFRVNTKKTKWMIIKNVLPIKLQCFQKSLKRLFLPFFLIN